jgi:hypothetical protein
MDTHAPACADLPPAARLLIHATDGAGHWSLESLLRRLRAHWRAVPADERAARRLEIHDLRGRRMLALDDAGPLVEVALPPGTYHVTARRGPVQRGYTVALEQGVSFDLHLRLPQPPRR